MRRIALTVTTTRSALAIAMAGRASRAVTPIVRIFLISEVFMCSPPRGMVH